MTLSIDIRKMVSYREDIRHEFGPPADKPITVAWTAAVINNPYAGGYVQDIEAFMDVMKPLGDEMAADLLRTIGCPASEIESYGKGAIVGTEGELEHGNLWHVPGGYAMRRMLGEALAIVPSSSKVAVAGTTLDVPLGHINAAYVRTHFSAIQVAISDAPRPREIVYAIAMSNGGRIHPRVGGLTQDQISVRDGQR